METRTAVIVNLVVAAMEAASYAVPDGAGGTQVIARPENYSVHNHPFHVRDLESGSAQGVYPVTEDPAFSAVGNGVMDCELVLAIESAAPLGSQPVHVAVDTLRLWAHVALVHNVALNAALREPPIFSRMRWQDPSDAPHGRVSIARCVQAVILKHRIAYAVPNVQR